MNFLPRFFSLLPFLLATLTPAARAEDKQGMKSIPMHQLGVEAQKQYAGDGISITPTEQGACLRSNFQKLEGEVTSEGLWLSSTEGGAERFRVLATAVGRSDTAAQPLPASGTVTTTADTAALMRPGLLEEYRVSMDGVQQDFVVMQRPEGAGALRVTLEVAGAQVSAADYGIRLTLPRSRREVGYGRLHVTDATGRELVARLEVLAQDRIVVCVEDDAAVYPVRIDPTFSDADWVSMNPGILGANGTVYALVMDGSGNLYAGGTFTQVGSATAANIAKWDGSTWSALGTGVNGKVRALTVNGTDLYAGGLFTTAGGGTANYIAKWNGTAWSALGSGMNGSVQALVMNGGTLYAGGVFTTAGGAAASYIAQWNGSAWSALGAGVDAEVQSLAVMGGSLYVGGRFATAGGGDASGVAKWDGSAWSALGFGLYGTVNALAVSGSTLYAGGYFSAGGRTNADNVAMWDGTSWSSIGEDPWAVAYQVQAMAVIGTDLYIGMNLGVGTNVGSERSPLLKWDGTSWSRLGFPPVNRRDFDVASAYALVANGTNLYVGGYFTDAGGRLARNLAKWDGSNWSHLQLGLNGSVLALATSGQNLYVGGNFTMAGNGAASNIVKWDGSTWTALGSGINGPVSALLLNGTDVYAGGTFTMAGGVEASNIAKWDGTSWSALGQGLNGTGYRMVYSLAMIGTDLYAAGLFTVTGNPAASGIARWDGSAWSALSTGLDGSARAYALAVMGTDLYVGGNFSYAGGVSANGIARWNGSSWSSVGTGFSPQYISAMAVIGTRLYVGGDYSIQAWDGSSWTSLSTDRGPILALAASGTNLYVGSAALSPYDLWIAKWDGNSWSGQTTENVFSNDLRIWGTTRNVTALAVDASNHLFVGGSGFINVGNNVASPYLAMVNLPTPAPDIAVTQSAALTDGARGVDFGPTVAWGGSTTLTFTLTNPGDAEISGLSINVDGANPDVFALSTLARSRFVPGESLTFTVTYTPSATGGSNAVLHIVSNVSGDKSSFDIALSGLGVTANQGWQQQYFGVITGAGNAAPEADPNHNGIPNLLEYALGGNPLGASAGASVLPGAMVNAGTNRLQLNFKRYVDRNDVTLTVQAADDLAGPWTDLVQSVRGSPFNSMTSGASAAESAVGNPHAVSVLDLYSTSDPMHPRRFMRLKVSQ